jgi:hypothetical protein
VTSRAPGTIRPRRCDYTTVHAGAYDRRLRGRRIAPIVRLQASPHFYRYKYLLSPFHDLRWWWVAGRSRGNNPSSRGLHDGHSLHTRQSLSGCRWRETRPGGSGPTCETGLPSVRHRSKLQGHRRGPGRVTECERSASRILGAPQPRHNCYMPIYILTDDLDGRSLAVWQPPAGGVQAHHSTPLPVILRPRGAGVVESAGSAVDDVAPAELHPRNRHSGFEAYQS